MAFKFKRKESVARAIRRLSKECIEKALVAFQERDQVEAIHSIRKEIKKLRALLRLARKEIGEDCYKKGVKDLRKAAKFLAPVRDAQVRLQTFENVLAHSRRQIPAHSFSRIRTIFRQQCREEAAAIHDRARKRTIKRLLRKQRAKFENLPIHGKGWSAIGPGIKRAYSAGGKAMEQARKNPTAKHFHTWRKRAKDLWYCIQLLEPIWPEQMGAVSNELEKLGELLGAEHDLHMLKRALKSISPKIDNAETLVHLIDRRQQELRTSALALGSHFYADDPFTFCTRLHQFWKAWRSKDAKQRTPPFLPLRFGRKPLV